MPFDKIKKGLSIQEVHDLPREQRMELFQRGVNEEVDPDEYRGKMASPSGINNLMPFSAPQDNSEIKMRILQQMANQGVDAMPPGPSANIDAIGRAGAIKANIDQKDNARLNSELADLQDLKEWESDPEKIKDLDMQINSKKKALGQF